MTIKTKSCKDCVFRVVETDHSTYFYTYCGLLANRRFYEEFSEASSQWKLPLIEFTKDGYIASKNQKTLDNCPILTDNITIEYE